MYFVLMCDDFAQSHMYFRLQPVLSTNLCSVGFAIANVDDFLSKCALQNGHKSRVLAAMNILTSAN